MNPTIFKGELSSITIPEADIIQPADNTITMIIDYLERELKYSGYGDEETTMVIETLRYRYDIEYSENNPGEPSFHIHQFAILNRISELEKRYGILKAEAVEEHKRSKRFKTRSEILIVLSAALFMALAIISVLAFS